MFTLPPRPPKDYVIKNVTNNLLSSGQFSPDSLPRVTQPNLGKFCFPIEYQENEQCDKRFSTEINPVIMEKMINDAKAMWVVPPGKDEFVLHDYKKYNVRKDPKSLDPRYFIKERCFPRSYRLELDCIESARLEKLHKKCVRENEDFENHFKFLVERQKRKEKPRIRVLSCKHKPPKWWKYSEMKKSEATKELAEYKTPEVDETTYAVKYERWQEEPNLTAFVEDDPCHRKADMLLVGAQFKNDACNWYYNKYPPPNPKLRFKKFS
ncbi:unnamed protein product [Acanthoscelides obtectus]|uniref:Uncharacterized protein n=1 Tax=Acanthoscelides obtectus TaxID=200917 RepID=A0A9P0PMQ4_ACAOB|nr:unnamed protein product [Acanthoscelides obtectus]CAK1638955.1 hypothetical protein AOBTE_LOCUS10906 [Acanthoscelides obtectus]